jgi:hypothetical protein
MCRKPRVFGWLGDLLPTSAIPLGSALMQYSPGGFIAQLHPLVLPQFSHL